MARESTQVNTVEDLVKLASVPHRAELRFTFDDHNEWRYSDEEVGKVWSDMQNEEWKLAHEHNWGTPEYIAAQAAYEAWQEAHPQPKRIYYKSYYLYHSSVGYSRGTTLELDATLGEQIAAVWNKEISRDGKTVLRYKNALTIKGILRRLGQSTKELDAKVKAVVAEQKRQAEVNSRNWARSQIKDAANKLQEAMTRNAEVLSFVYEGSSLQASIESLLALENES